MTATAASISPAELSERLLDWYDRHRRRLPWRALPGVPADPYRVWLSEIMLQQTTVATVGRYFEAFVDRWPKVEDLAAAPLDDVLVAWAGLGYYARARNLHRCAQAVVELHAGQFPETVEGLKTLPGVGDYTAAAVAAIAFDRRATVLDGNVERVVARLRLVHDPLPGSKPKLRALADEITPAERAGDYAQAIMDLGATVCTPRKPKCTICPWSDGCAARIADVAEQLPTKTPKKRKPVRSGTCFFLVSASGRLLLRRRPETGLLGGMQEVPSTSWDTNGSDPDGDLRFAPIEGVAWQPLPGIVRHTFTHFHLELSVLAARLPDEPQGLDGRWWPLDRLDDAALPTVMAKVIKHAVNQLA